MILTTWPNLWRPRDGHEVETTTAALMARVLTPKTYRFANLWPRYAFAAFVDGYRCLAAFRFAEAVVLDLDRGATAERIEATFGDLFGFAHTTKRSEPSRPRWRVALYLSRHVSGAEFPRVWRGAAELVEREGVQPDYAARDASRAWAAPGAGPHYQALELRGAFFDVDAALEGFPVETAPTFAPSSTTSDDVQRRIERARRYLSRMDAAISGSHGHAATIRAASAMVVGCDLPLDVALELLVTEYNPRCSPPWSLGDLRHKVKSAARDARMPFGWLADAKRSA